MTTDFDPTPTTTNQCINTSFNMHGDDHPKDHARPEYDVAIVGAGPVGLLLGSLLGAKGLKVVLLEKRTQPLFHSQAFGITPPSLQILSKLGLDREFISRGTRIYDCYVTGEKGCLGSLTFRDLPVRYNYFLSLPQADTIAILREHIEDYPNVKVRTGVEVTNLHSSETSCRVDFTHRKVKNEHGSISASYVVACDGSKSRVRELIRMPASAKTYDCHFVMGDFVDRTGMSPEDAHLFFTADGTVEAFPLPGGLRRWIVQTPSRMDVPPPGFISTVVKRRAGLRLDQEDQINQSTVTPRRLNCQSYHLGRVVLCGDAAHVMSPVGGQGMNTGFADAEFLADALVAIMCGGRTARPLLDAYSRYRREAAGTAIVRAERGMWLGTWLGKASSLLRDFIIRHLLLKGPLSRRLAPYFAMLTIPYNSIENVPLPVLQLQTP